MLVPESKLFPGSNGASDNCHPEMCASTDQVGFRNVSIIKIALVLSIFIVCNLSHTMQKLSHETHFDIP